LRQVPSLLQRQVALKNSSYVKILNGLIQKYCKFASQAPSFYCSDQVQDMIKPNLIEIYILLFGDEDSVLISS
jgi:hypothetical protein